jgi:hypothetical protein
MMKEQLGDLAGHGELLLEGLRHLPASGQEPQQLWRGAKMSQAEVEVLRKSQGKLACFKAFASWSTDPKQAERFPCGPLGADQVEVFFHVTSAGRPQIGVFAATAVGRDEEVVIPPLSVVTIGKVMKAKGRCVIQLTDASLAGEETYAKASRLRDGPLGGRGEAGDLFRQAAALGHVKAKGEYARCLIDGDGVKIDRSEKTYRISAEAAKDGDPLGQAVCGRCCGAGWGCRKDQFRAYRFAKTSADAGNSYGIFVLGECLREGWGCTNDVVKAIGYYRQAAERNLPAALTTLGSCYGRGIGVDKDENEAVRLYRLAAEQGYARAQFNLGVCYADGIGVEKDRKEAVRLYRLAAEQGLALAQ